MILADKIIEERKRNGWSQEELADQLGYPDRRFPSGRVPGPFRTFRKSFNWRSFLE